MAVGRRAQEGHRRAALLGERLDDDVHGKGDAREQVARDIRVAADCEVLPRVHGEQPVADLWSLREQVAPRLGEELVVGQRRRLRAMLEREGQRATRRSRERDQPAPDLLAVQVDGDDVGAEGEQHLERAHRRAGAEEYEVTVREVEPALRPIHLGGGSSCGYACAVARVRISAELAASRPYLACEIAAPQLSSHTPWRTHLSS